MWVEGQRERTLGLSLLGCAGGLQGFGESVIISPFVAQQQELGRALECGDRVPHVVSYLGHPPRVC